MIRATHYRPDIDGLRAFAILSVLFFHAEFPPFQGGYIGVDVFFVISGFLITQLIRNEYISGIFSYRNFYVRRARRLLPALFFTYTLCWLCGYALLSADHFEQFGSSLVASVFSYSNFYFLHQTGYFDTETVFKPLLHSWSLSVEEQFYLLWPVSFIFLLKRKNWGAPLCLIVAAVISLMLNQIYLEQNFALFYLIPFRVYEFCIGALMVWIVPLQPKNKLLLEPLLLLGLAMIAYAAMSFTRMMVFPSYYALLPCIGAALVIYSGTAKYCGRILNNRPAVFIGLISYSLYLVHWPALIFYKYYRFAEPAAYEIWLVLAVCFVLAACMYEWVEKPFRKNGWVALKYPTWKFVAASIAAAFVIALVGHETAVRHGFPRRIPPLALSAQLQKTQTYTECKDGYGICPKSHAKPQYVMIGDSHTNRMRQLLAVITQRRKQNLEVYTSLACLGVYDSGLPCAADMNKEFESVLARHIPNVILVSSWSPYTHNHPVDFLLAKIQSTIQKLQQEGVHVYVYGSMPVMHRTPSSCFQRPFTGDCKEYMVPQDYDKQIAFNNRLRETVIKSGAKYFDLFAALCKPEGCRVAYQGLSLYGDRFHLDDMNFGSYMLLLNQDKQNISFDDIFKSR